MGRGAGLALHLRWRGQRGPDGREGFLAVPVLEGAGGAVLRSVLAGGVRCVGLSCWEMSVQRAGAVLLAASTPGQLPLDQIPSPPTLAVGPGPPVWGPGPGPMAGGTRHPEPGSAGSQRGISHHLTLGHAGIFVVLFCTQK